MASGNSIFAKPLRKNASKLHREVLSLLKQLFPGYTILEERVIEADVRGRLGLLPVDIAIKELKMAFECQGEQHFKFIPHFHQSQEDFLNQQSRDRAKAEALSMCGWSLITLNKDDVKKMTRARLMKLVKRAMKEPK